jgi:crotonobetainyl-CoA:carnitine CoA-transferase CaiB-like acyl-CoA transferase
LIPAARRASLPGRMTADDDQRTTMARALQRFRVLDLTRVRAGPTAVRQLADFGADVIKIEAPQGAGIETARHGSDFQNLHRNKRSLTLDLKKPEGKAVFLRLVATADVVVENYRPDVKYRLGIDYDSLRAINPRLVYASVSGYGEDGPYRARPGFDQIAQGMGGLMSITGKPGEGPVRAGIAVADTTAGLYCALGILTALLEREVSGEGQWIRTSLLQAQIATLDFQAARWLMDKVVPPQMGNDHPTMVPMGVFPAQDMPINIAVSGTPMFVKLCAALGAPRLAEDPRFSGHSERLDHREALKEEIGRITREQPAAHWIDRLNDAGVPCGPIYTIDQTFADPQVRHLGIAQAVDHPILGRIELVGQPIEMSRTPAQLATASPEAGEQTGEILREAGYDVADIAALRRDGIV